MNGQIIVPGDTVLYNSEEFYVEEIVESYDEIHIRIEDNNESHWVDEEDIELV